MEKIPIKIKLFESAALERVLDRLCLLNSFEVRTVSPLRVFIGADINRQEYEQFFGCSVEKKTDEYGIQYWKELMRSIGESYYSGFLVKIDKLIKEKGIGYVVSRFHILCEDKTSD